MRKKIERKLFLSIYWKTSLLSSLAMVTACAYTGPTTATGEGASATGGSSRANAQLLINLSLDPKVASAASEAVQSYLGGRQDPVTEEDKSEATRIGIEAGLAEMRQNGEQVTPEKEKALKQHVNSIIQRPR